MAIQPKPHDSWAGMARRLALAACLLALPPAARAGEPEPFLALPYLQLGGAPAADALSLLWHAPDRDGAWSVAVRDAGGERVVPAHLEPGGGARGGAAPGLHGRAAPAGARGGRFTYRVLLRAGRCSRPKPRRARARASPPGWRCWAIWPTAGPAGRDIALALCRQAPDLVVLPGDLVYEDGRISRIPALLLPALQRGRPPPLLRSTLVVGALGNHDVGERGARHPVAADPDSMAYYLYWDQPLNGPRHPAPRPSAPAADFTWGPLLAARRASASPSWAPSPSTPAPSTGPCWIPIPTPAGTTRPCRTGWPGTWRRPGAPPGASWCSTTRLSTSRRQPLPGPVDGPVLAAAGAEPGGPRLHRPRPHLRAHPPIRFTPDPASLAAARPRTQQGQVRGPAGLGPPGSTAAGAPGPGG